MFKNVRLASLLGAGFGALILVLVIVVGLSIFNFQRTAEARHLNDHTFRVITLTDDIMASLIHMETGLRGFIITGLEEYLEPYEQGREHFTRLYAELQDMTADSPAHVERLSSLMQRYELWMDSAVTPTIHMREDLNKDIGNFQMLASTVGYGRNAMDAMRAILEEIRTDEQTLLTEREAILDRNDLVTTVSLVGGLIIGVLIGVLTALFVIRLITGAVRQALEAARAVAAGDLSVKIDADGRNELRQLLAALGGMVDGLRGMIAEITGSATQVSSASEQISVIADRTLRDTERQKDQTTQVATAVNQMTITIQEIARNTQQTADAANDSRYKVSEGKTVVTDTIDGMERLTREVERVARAVRQLGEHSENIGTVLDVIRGIADQTNLLALNAAIEAARAGDHGRGFAVVAAEVRQLASRTQASIGEIEEMIAELQTGARQAVEAMEQGRNQATENMKKAEQTGVTFDAIAESVQTIGDMTSQIASAVEEQTSVAEDINRNVISIHDITEQTHGSTQETAASSDSMAALAAQLQGMVTRFKV